MIRNVVLVVGFLVIQLYFLKITSLKEVTTPLTKTNAIIEHGEY